jgi:protein-S-isoprenylcysteine O-methyltransferase Ste14
MTQVKTDPTVNNATPSRSGPDELLREYHDARRREDQWRIPQILLALVTPILALVSVLFAMGGETTNATISGALAVITGVGAALLAVEVWRWHRTAIGIGNSFRTTYPGEASRFLGDPL